MKKFHKISGILLALCVFAFPFEVLCFVYLEVTSETVWNVLLIHTGVMWTLYFAMILSGMEKDQIRKREV